MIIVSLGNDIGSKYKVDASQKADMTEYLMYYTKEIGNVLIIQENLEFGNNVIIFIRNVDIFRLANGQLV